MAPDVEAPLLAASSKPATAAAASLPRRNKYPFFCAVLASMTSVLMGYSTHAPSITPSASLAARAPPTPPLTFVVWFLQTWR